MEQLPSPKIDHQVQSNTQSPTAAAPHGGAASHSPRAAAGSEGLYNPLMLLQRNRQLQQGLVTLPPMSAANFKTSPLTARGASAGPMTAHAHQASSPPRPNPYAFGRPFTATAGIASVGKAPVPAETAKISSSAATTTALPPATATQSIHHQPIVTSVAKMTSDELRQLNIRPASSTTSLPGGPLSSPGQRYVIRNVHSANSSVVAKLPPKGSSPQRSAAPTEAAPTTMPPLFNHRQQVDSEVNQPTVGVEPQDATPLRHVPRPPSASRSGGSPPPSSHVACSIETREAIVDTYDFGPVRQSGEVHKLERRTVIEPSGNSTFSSVKGNTEADPTQPTRSVSQEAHPARVTITSAVAAQEASAAPDSTVEPPQHFSRSHSSTIQRATSPSSALLHHTTAHSEAPSLATLRDPSSGELPSTKSLYNAAREAVRCLLLGEPIAKNSGLSPGPIPSPSAAAQLSETLALPPLTTAHSEAKPVSPTPQTVESGQTTAEGASATTIAIDPVPLTHIHSSLEMLMPDPINYSDSPANISRAGDSGKSGSGEPVTGIRRRQASDPNSTQSSTASPPFASTTVKTGAAPPTADEGAVKVEAPPTVSPPPNLPIEGESEDSTNTINNNSALLLGTDKHHSHPQLPRLVTPQQQQGSQIPFEALKMTFHSGGSSMGPPDPNNVTAHGGGGAPGRTFASNTTTSSTHTAIGVEGGATDDGDNSATKCPSSASTNAPPATMLMPSSLATVSGNPQLSILNSTHSLSGTTNQMNLTVGSSLAAASGSKSLTSGEKTLSVLVPSNKTLQSTSLLDSETPVQRQTTTAAAADISATAPTQANVSPTLDATADEEVLMEGISNAPRLAVSIAQRILNSSSSNQAALAPTAAPSIVTTEAEPSSAVGVQQTDKTGTTRLTSPSNLTKKLSIFDPEGRDTFQSMRYGGGHHHHHNKPKGSAAAPFNEGEPITEHIEDCGKAHHPSYGVRSATFHYKFNSSGAAVANLVPLSQSVVLTKAGRAIMHSKRPHYVGNAVMGPGGKGDTAAMDKNISAMGNTISMINTPPNTGRPFTAGGNLSPTQVTATGTAFLKSGNLSRMGSVSMFPASANVVAAAQHTQQQTPQQTASELPPASTSRKPSPPQNLRSNSSSALNRQGGPFSSAVEQHLPMPASSPNEKGTNQQFPTSSAPPRARVSPMTPTRAGEGAAVAAAALLPPHPVVGVDLLPMNTNYSYLCGLAGIKGGHNGKVGAGNVAAASAARECFATIATKSHTVIDGGYSSYSNPGQLSGYACLRHSGLSSTALPYSTTATDHAHQLQQDPFDITTFPAMLLFGPIPTHVSLLPSNGKATPPHQLQQRRTRSQEDGGAGATAARTATGGHHHPSNLRGPRSHSSPLPPQAPRMTTTATLVQQQQHQQQQQQQHHIQHPIRASVTVTSMGASLSSTPGLMGVGHQARSPSASNSASGGSFSTSLNKETVLAQGDNSTNSGNPNFQHYHATSINTNNTNTFTAAAGTGATGTGASGESSTGSTASAIVPPIVPSLGGLMLCHPALARALLTSDTSSSSVAQQQTASAPAGDKTSPTLFASTSSTPPPQIFPNPQQLPILPPIASAHTGTVIIPFESILSFRLERVRAREIVPSAPSSKGVATNEKTPCYSLYQPPLLKSALDGCDPVASAGRWSNAIFSHHGRVSSTDDLSQTAHQQNTGTDDANATINTNTGTVSTGGSFSVNRAQPGTVVVSALGGGSISEHPTAGIDSIVVSLDVSENKPTNPHGPTTIINYTHGGQQHQGGNRNSANSPVYLEQPTLVKSTATTGISSNNNSSTGTPQKGGGHHYVPAHQQRAGANSGGVPTHFVASQLDDEYGLIAWPPPSSPQNAPTGGSPAPTPRSSSASHPNGTSIGNVPIVSKQLMAQQQVISEVFAQSDDSATKQLGAYLSAAGAPPRLLKNLTKAIEEAEDEAQAKKKNSQEDGLVSSPPHTPRGLLGAIDSDDDNPAYLDVLEIDFIPPSFVWASNRAPGKQATQQQQQGAATSSPTRLGYGTEANPSMSEGDNDEDLFNLPVTAIRSDGGGEQHSESTAGAASLRQQSSSGLYNNTTRTQAPRPSIPSTSQGVGASSLGDKDVFSSVVGETSANSILASVEGISPHQVPTSGDSVVNNVSFPGKVMIPTTKATARPIENSEAGSVLDKLQRLVGDPDQALAAFQNVPRCLLEPSTGLHLRMAVGTQERQQQHQHALAALANTDSSSSDAIPLSDLPHVLTVRIFSAKAREVHQQIGQAILRHSQAVSMGLYNTVVSAHTPRTPRGQGASAIPKNDDGQQSTEPSRSEQLAPFVSLAPSSATTARLSALAGNALITSSTENANDTLAAMGRQDTGSVFNGNVNSSSRLVQSSSRGVAAPPAAANNSFAGSTANQQNPRAKGFANQSGISPSSVGNKPIVTFHNSSSNGQQDPSSGPMLPHAPPPLRSAGSFTSGGVLSQGSSPPTNSSAVFSTTAPGRGGASTTVGGNSTSSNNNIPQPSNMSGSGNSANNSTFYGQNSSTNSGIKTLTIVHFNDVYNLDTQSGPDSRGLVGGAARFNTVLERIREYDNPLVCFSGDFIAPSLMSVEMKGRHMVDAFNLFGVHYGTWGNHEFDYGKKSLSDAIHGYAHGPHVYAGSNSKWISTNMFEGPTYRAGDIMDEKESPTTKKDGKKEAPREAIHEKDKDRTGSQATTPIDDAKNNASDNPNAKYKRMKPIAGALRREIFIWNGVTVGIMGISENWLPSCAMLAPSDWVYQDMFECAEETAQELRLEGAEVVICLSHSRIANDKELMKRCPSVDLLLGGHDHFYRCVPNLRIVKGGAEFMFLTEIRIELSATGLITHNLTSSADLATVPNSNASVTSPGSLQQSAGLAQSSYVANPLDMPPQITLAEGNTPDTASLQGQSTTSSYNQLMGGSSGGGVPAPFSFVSTSDPSTLLGNTMSIGTTNIPPGAAIALQRRQTILDAQKGFDRKELIQGRFRHQVMNLQIFCHPITVDIPEHPQTSKLVVKYNQKLGERMDGVIGKALIELDPREQTCRFREGILTGFVCDVIVSELNRLKYKADFALLGGAAFSGKATIPVGDLKVGDIFSCFPNDTRIMCLRMKGEVVIRVLNAMIKEMPAEAPSFPHCSGGLKFTINLFKTPPQVEDVCVRGEPIGINTEYVVGLETFAGLGKAKYKFIPPNSTTLLDGENAAQLVHWLIAFFLDKQGQKKEKADAEAAAILAKERGLKGGAADVMSPLTSNPDSATTTKNEKTNPTAVGGAKGKDGQRRFSSRNSISQRRRKAIKGGKKAGKDDSLSESDSDDSDLNSTNGGLSHQSSRNGRGGGAASSASGGGKKSKQQSKWLFDPMFTPYNKFKFSDAMTLLEKPMMSRIFVASQLLTELPTEQMATVEAVGLPVVQSPMGAVSSSAEGAIGNSGQSTMGGNGMSNVGHPNARGGHTPPASFLAPAHSFTPGASIANAPASFAYASQAQPASAMFSASAAPTTVGSMSTNLNLTNNSDKSGGMASAIQSVLAMGSPFGANTNNNGSTIGIRKLGVSSIAGASVSANGATAAPGGLHALAAADNDTSQSPSHGASALVGTHSIYSLNGRTTGGGVPPLFQQHAQNILSANNAASISGPSASPLLIPIMPPKPATMSNQLYRILCRLDETQLEEIVRSIIPCQYVRVYLFDPDAKALKRLPTVAGGLASIPIDAVSAAAICATNKVSLNIKNMRKAREKNIFNDTFDFVENAPQFANNSNNNDAFGGNAGTTFEGFVPSRGTSLSRGNTLFNNTTHSHSSGSPSSLPPTHQNSLNPAATAVPFITTQSASGFMPSTAATLAGAASTSAALNTAPTSIIGASSALNTTSPANTSSRGAAGLERGVSFSTNSGTKSSSALTVSPSTTNYDQLSGASANTQRSTNSPPSMSATPSPQGILRGSQQHQGPLVLPSSVGVSTATSSESPTKGHHHPGAKTISSTNATSNNTPPASMRIFQPMQNPFTSTNSSIDTVSAGNNSAPLVGKSVAFAAGATAATSVLGGGNSPGATSLSIDHHRSSTAALPPASLGIHPSLPSPQLQPQSPSALQALPLRAEINTLLCVPIVFKNKVVGVIQAINKLDKKELKRERKLKLQQKRQQVQQQLLKEQQMRDAQSSPQGGGGGATMGNKSTSSKTRSSVVSDLNRSSQREGRAVQRGSYANSTVAANAIDSEQPPASMLMLVEGANGGVASATGTGTGTGTGAGRNNNNTTYFPFSENDIVGDSMDRPSGMVGSTTARRYLGGNGGSIAFSDSDDDIDEEDEEGQEDSDDFDNDESYATTGAGAPFIQATESMAFKPPPLKFQNEKELDHLQILASTIAKQLNHRKMAMKMLRSEAVKVDLMNMARMLGTANRDEDVKAIIFKIAGIACSVFNCDRASVFLVEKGSLWTVVRGKEGEMVTIRFPVGKGIAGECARTGNLSNIHDAYACPLFNVNIDKQTGYRTRTILAVPIMAENKIDLVGVLQLINKNDSTVFSSEDVELALNFVDLASIAIHNSFEIETLRVDSGTSGLQELTAHELNRIYIKGGWKTIREKLAFIISADFARKLADIEDEERLTGKRLRALQRKIEERRAAVRAKIEARKGGSDRGKRNSPLSSDLPTTGSETTTEAGSPNDPIDRDEHGNELPPLTLEDIYDDEDLSDSEASDGDGPLSADGEPRVFASLFEMYPNAGADSHEMSLDPHNQLPQPQATVTVPRTRVQLSKETQLLALGALTASYGDAGTIGGAAAIATSGLNSASGATDGLSGVTSGGMGGVLSQQDRNAIVSQLLNAHQQQQRMQTALQLGGAAPPPMSLLRPPSAQQQHMFEREPVKRKPSPSLNLAEESPSGYPEHSPPEESAAVTGIRVGSAKPHRHLSTLTATRVGSDDHDGPGSMSGSPDDYDPSGLRHISTTVVFEPVQMPMLATFMPMAVSRIGGPPNGAAAKPSPSGKAMLPAVEPSTNTANITITSGGGDSSSNTNNSSFVTGVSQQALSVQPMSQTNQPKSKVYIRKLERMRVKLETTRLELVQLEQKLRKLAQKKRQSQDAVIGFGSNATGTTLGSGTIEAATTVSSLPEPSSNTFFKQGGEAEEHLLLFASKLGDLATSMLECDRASIYFCKDDDIIGYRKDQDKSKTRLQLPIGVGVAGKCAELGRTMNVPNAYKCEFFNRTFDKLTGYRTNTILCLPLLTADGAGVVSVLQLINKDDGSVFDADDEFAASILLSLSIDILRKYFALDVHVLEGMALAPK